MSNWPDRSDCWHVYYGDVQVGTIAARAGVPVGVDQWGWQCGFYPPSHHGRHTEGTAATFEQARGDFEGAWKEYFPKCTEADFEDYRRQEVDGVEVRHARRPSQTADAVY